MSEEKLDEIATLLKELVKWSKFSGKQHLKKLLEDSLRKDAEKIVYEYSDGERSARDLEKLSGVSRTSVTNYWKKWVKLGIVEESKKFTGRMQHICSLEEVGIEIPSLTQPTTIEPEDTTSGDDTKI